MFITKGFVPIPVNLKGKEHSAQGEEQFLAGIHSLVLSMPHSLYHSCSTRALWGRWCYRGG